MQIHAQDIHPNLMEILEIHGGAPTTTSRMLGGKGAERVGEWGRGGWAGGRGPGVAGGCEGGALVQEEVL